MNVLMAILVALSGAAHLLGEYFGWMPVIYVCKPLTMLLIIAMAIGKQKRVPKFYGYLILMGLGFSLIGDVLLMVPRDLFLYGLVSFLVAQICYIVAFRRGVKIRLTLLVMPFALFGILMYWLLWPGLEQMKIPVLLYLIIILLMGWLAAERHTKLPNRFTRWAAVGAVLFIISDAILAVNRFRFDFAFSTYLVMISYYFAQWLIASSIDEEVSRGGNL